MLHCMAKNPEAQEKFYREIQSVLGNRTQPTPEDFIKMPYLKGCMHAGVIQVYNHVAKAIRLYTGLLGVTYWKAIILTGYNDMGGA